jgi:hypothetical protein
VLLIVSYRALQDRDGFIPLFKHKHIKAAAARRFSVVAKGRENTLKALEIAVRHAQLGKASCSTAFTIYTVPHSMINVH